MGKMWNESEEKMGGETWPTAYRRLTGREFSYKDVASKDKSDPGEYNLVMRNGWKVRVLQGDSYITSP